jgi:hypothetical protein
MKTLASELGPHAERLAGQPRVYVDANMPAGVVAFMRAELAWDVLFVMEHDDLRRAPDADHYRLARQLRRTLITLDRDYLDDRRFPLEESGGVLVLQAPEERGLAAIVKRIDREVFRSAADTMNVDGSVIPLPLERRKLHLHVDWAGLSSAAPPAS